jgi:hypothetical protein
MPEMIIAHRESVIRKIDELENTRKHKEFIQIRLKHIPKYKRAMAE